MQGLHSFYREVTNFTNRGFSVSISSMPEENRNYETLYPVFQKI